MDETTINEELARVLAGEQFKQSNRLSKFLTYLVAAHLDGTAGHLSETVIAKEVFGKTVDFHPALDSVVRVSAKRLRNAIADYYSELGAQNPIKISIPPGSYEPSFETNERLQSELEPSSGIIESKRSNKKFKSQLYKVGLALAGVLIPLVGISSFSFKQTTNEPSQPSVVKSVQRYPKIAVLPFENLTGNEEFDVLEKGFQSQIIREMEFFRIIQVISSDKPLEEIIGPNDEGFDFAITGGFLSLYPEFDAQLALVDLNSRQRILNKPITLNTLGKPYFEILSEFSNEVTEQFSGADNKLLEIQRSVIERQITQSSFMLGNPSAFICLSTYEAYLASNTIEKFNKIWECLPAELENSPGDANIMAALAHIKWYVGLANENPEYKNNHLVLKEIDLDPTVTIDEANLLAREAIDLDVSNFRSLEVIANLQIANRDYEAALLSLEQALDINHDKPQTVALYAKALMFAGRWDEAKPLAVDALERAEKKKFNFYEPLIYHSIYTGDVESLKIYTEPFGRPGQRQNYFSGYFKFIYDTVISILENDEQAIVAARPKALEYRNDMNGDLFWALSESGVSDEYMNKLEGIFNSGDIDVRSDLKD